MQIRIAAADAPSAFETLEAVGLIYDTVATDFSILGGALRVRLLEAPAPIRIEFDTDGQVLWFRSTAEAARFSEALREARITASGLDITMLD